ncbi:hypothetical protein M1466_00650 [Candidatus Dependentiae bacterium]|nr:hypothetical protein [Candidatus Dependentiae bacterium]
MQLQRIINISLLVVGIVSQTALVAMDDTASVVAESDCSSCCGDHHDDHAQVLDKAPALTVHTLIGYGAGRRWMRLQREKVLADWQKQGIVFAAPSLEQIQAVADAYVRFYTVALPLGGLLTSGLLHYGMTKAVADVYMPTKTHAVVAYATGFAMGVAHEKLVQYRHAASAEKKIQQK